MSNKEHPLGLIIPDQIGEQLLRNEHTVAVAESVTAGHLQEALSLAANAMNFFQGGITTYNLGQKSRHLHVEPVHALSCNCVSEKVAAQMAQQVASLFSSDWGIGITGYASPVPEKNIHKLFACYSIYFRGAEKTTQTISVEKNTPLYVRIEYTNAVLKHFLQVLLP